jgi:hypothetical protein
MNKQTSKGINLLVSFAVHALLFGVVCVASAWATYAFGILLRQVRGIL